MGEIYMVLFKVGDLDITPFIVAGSYAVSSQPEYDTWYDGNRTERRGIKRWKLKGSFNVKFMDANDYRSFLASEGVDASKHKEIIKMVAEFYVDDVQRMIDILASGDAYEIGRYAYEEI